MSDRDIIETIDAATERLLENAGFGGTVPAENAEKVPLAEQVKAYQAAVDWAKTRHLLRPPEKEKGGFDGIRERFSQAHKRRRRPREAESDPTPANGSAVLGPEPAVDSAVLDS